MAFQPVTKVSRDLLFINQRTHLSLGVYIQDVSYFGGGGGPPQGALSADAQYMTEQLLSVTQGSRNNSVTIHRTTPSNIRYELELDAHGILADGVVSAMGPAVIAAVFADGMSHPVHRQFCGNSSSTDLHISN